MSQDQSNAECMEFWVPLAVADTSTHIGQGSTFDLVDSGAPTWGAAILQKVLVRKEALREQVAELVSLADSWVDGWGSSRVRLDEVSFQIQVGTDGAVKVVLGANVQGTIGLKFKVDPPQAPTSATGEG